MLFHDEIKYTASNYFQWWLFILEWFLQRLSVVLHESQTSLKLFPNSSLNRICLYDPLTTATFSSFGTEDTKLSWSPRIFDNDENTGSVAKARLSLK
jgi:hypothetical protein